MTSHFASGGIFSPFYWMQPVAGIISPWIEATTSVRMGTAPGTGGTAAASQGTFQLQEDGSIIFRNAADGGDVSGVWLDGVNNYLWIGGVYGTAAYPERIYCGANTSMYLQIGVNARFRIDANGAYAVGSWRVRHIDIDDTDSPYTIVETYGVLLVDSTGGPVTVTLPAAATCTDRVVTIKDWGGGAAANPITVNPQAGEQLDNGGAGVGLVININNGSMTVFSDGVKWGTI